MRSQFRQLIDSSPDAVLIVDPDGRIRQVNQAAADLFGYDRERLRGESVRTLFPEQQLPPCGGDPAAWPGTGHRLELIGSHRDATRFPAEVTVIPVQSRDGSVAVAQVRDLTGARRTQAVLERTLEFLVSSNRDRQSLVGHLVRVQEDERKRIAAGIHDDTIQVISAAHLRVQQLRRRVRDPSEVEVVDKLDEALQLSLQRLRQLIFDLRPSGLEAGHLTDALRSNLEGMRTTTGIAFEVEDRIATTVPESAALLIYRTAQEALTNVRQHARASMVRVELSDLDGGYRVRITDDGVGYDPADVEHRPGHLGLLLMRERPRLAGGWCAIESAPGVGTTVEFWVPAEAPAETETAA